MMTNRITVTIQYIYRYFHYFADISLDTVCADGQRASQLHLVRWLSKFNVTGRTKVPNLAWSFFSTYLLILSVEPT